VLPSRDRAPCALRQAERARFASRAANAEEQLEQLQAYLSQHIASYQKEILSLRRQVAGAERRR
jgi:phage shock protein A